MSEQAAENKAVQLINWLIEKAIEGVPPLSSAEDLAQEYLIDQSYPDDEERIESLINWETTKNFTTGFITGLGGILTLPVTLPAGFGASWIIQARMAAAIAKIAGYDLQSDRVRTFVVACLVGDALKDIVKSTGIQIGKGLSKSLINKIPGKALIEINKKVGFRLMTKAGEKGAINLMRGVPFIGGIVGGAFDAGACRVVGKNAKKLFYRQGTFSP
jgi:EcsC protein family